MKPFNLEQALAGAAVCTRDGREAKVIHVRKDGTLVVIHEDETIRYHGKNGQWGIPVNGFDLFLKSETKEGWVRIPTSNIWAVIDNYDICLTEKEAQERWPKSIVGKVTWEE